MSDKYSGRLRYVVDAARLLGPVTAMSRDDAIAVFRQALDDLHPTTLDRATWEPHDWSDFE